MCLAASGVSTPATSTEAEIVGEDINDEPVDPLDSIIEVFSDNASNPEITEVIEDESHGDFLVIIILLCLIVPLLALFGFIIYVSRKNRQEEIQDREIALSHLESTVVQESSQKSHLDDETINIMPADSEKLEITQGEGRENESVMEMFIQVPNDNEIKELLRGRSVKEKRTLLKEIEKAKQQKIHLECILKQQKNQADERWAIRNVEEKQAIEAWWSKGRQEPSSYKVANDSSQKLVVEDRTEPVIVE